MNISKLQHVYFVGIGGIGMSALARYFKAIGKNVSGYDKTPTPLTDELVREGIEVHFKDDAALLPEIFRSSFADQDSAMVVYTPAVPKDHVQLNFLKTKGYSILKRSEVLGLITRNAYLRW